MAIVVDGDLFPHIALYCSSAHNSRSDYPVSSSPPTRRCASDLQPLTGSYFNTMALLPVAPTNTTMDPEQRTRLLRTARKIEALLGTTPQVVDSRSRRRNDVYVSQFSSSASSLESTSSEEHSRRRPDVRDVFSGSSPSSISSYSSSPKVLVANYDRKTKKSKGGRQPLAQPLLLRMSAVPVDHRRRQSTSSIGNLGFSSSSGTIPPRPKLIPAPIPAPPLITPFERRKFKVDSVLGPLSPLNVSHFPVRDLDLPSTPTSTMSDMQDTATITCLTDREKRIKMAKLQRMMGENIPPELVFRDTTRKLVAKSDKKMRRRSRSLSALRNTATAPSPVLEEPEKKECKGKGKEIDTVVRPLRPLPTLPVPTSPPPRSLPPTPAAPMITQTTTTTTSIPLFRQLSLSMKQKGRKSRPRSLTLGTASAFVAANIKLAQQEKEIVETAGTVRGTVSLDEGRRWLKKEGDDDNNDGTQVLSVERPDAPFRRKNERIENIAVLKTEIWRRKEREWSGEWNVKDMDEVAKALRGLRAN